MQEKLKFFMVLLHLRAYAYGQIFLTELAGFKQNEQINDVYTLLPKLQNPPNLLMNRIYLFFLLKKRKKIFIDFQAHSLFYTSITNVCVITLTIQKTKKKNISSYLAKKNESRFFFSLLMRKK